MGLKSFYLSKEKQRAKKLIGVDASPLVREHYSGTEWYLWNLISALTKRPEASRYDWFLYGPKPVPDGLRLPKNWHWKELNWPFSRGWLQGRLSLEMWKCPPSLLFIPANSLPFVLPKYTITSLHDICFINLPHCYRKKERLRQVWSARQAVHRAKAVITISEASKKAIIKHYPKVSEKIKVVPLAINNSLYQVHREPGHKNSYILFVGRLTRKKNLSVLIQAFAMLKKSYRFKNVHLYLVGPKGLGTEEIKREAKVSKFITIIPWQNENKLIRLIQNASMLVLPSICEGFGLTILEAQVCEIPVIASDISVLRETAGDGALFFPVNSSEMLTKIMFSLLTEPDLRSSLIKKGSRNAARFSLEKMAEQTLSVLEKALS